MREPPPDLADRDLLHAVREHWDGDIAEVAHLPLGFGAHHWAAYGDAVPRLFVTLDGLAPHHSAESLEAAYVGAPTLHDQGLAFVLAPLPATGGAFTVPLRGRALSCTPWVSGESGGPLDGPWTSAALARLHATTPPAGLPRWRPLVESDFAEATAALVARAWGPGPYADTARDAVRRHLADLDRWTQRYHHLAEVAGGRAWVATHGEPHSGNQLLASHGRLLVDWESLRLAPAERDLRTLADAGVATEADPEMLELFDLEWRLDEISQYAARFAAPHPGGPDDEIAFGGLLDELERE
ncbi:MAG: spectinomycin phosphotransferase [Nocardioidaceae bacterium]|nr:spectinomycin phosphotransferase [Nocardioidaceae bacterium]